MHMRMHMHMHMHMHRHRHRHKHMQHAHATCACTCTCNMRMHSCVQCMCTEDLIDPVDRARLVEFPASSKPGCNLYGTQLQPLPQRAAASVARVAACSIQSVKSSSSRSDEPRGRLRATDPKLSCAWAGVAPGPAVEALGLAWAAAFVAAAFVPAAEAAAAEAAAAEAALRSGVAKERGVARGGGAASTRNEGSSCRQRAYDVSK